MEPIDTQGKVRRFGQVVKTAGPAAKAAGTIVLAALLFAAGAAGILETNEAGYVTVKQSILTGKVSIITEPGMFCQCFGAITKYREAGTVRFVQREADPADKPKARPGKERDYDPQLSGEIEVRFNDGGLGWISVMSLFDLPKDQEKLGLIHQKFRSYANLIEAGIKPTIQESVVLTAALMNSGESYTTKRAIFSEWARDQLGNGTYVTEETVAREQDPGTGDVIEKSVVTVKTDGDTRLRNENPLARYGIHFKQFQVTQIRYEPETENLIKTKREALQQTIAAKIAAERAIQERLAAEELGKKKVKIAEYEAMVKKKQAEVEAEEEKAVAVIAAEKKLEVARITKEQDLGAAKKRVELEQLARSQALVEAEKALEVAKLNVQTAERNKQAQVLEGQGLGEKKRLIYQADGALQQKLDAYVEVMTVLAKELGRQKWVPDITMNAGRDGAADGNAAAGFMNLWMMKTAKDLGIELVAEKKER